MVPPSVKAMSSFVTLFLSFGAIIAIEPYGHDSQSERNSFWPQCMSAVSRTRSYGSINTEHNRKALIAAFEREFLRGSQSNTPSNFAFAQYWLRRFLEMKATMTNCGLRWCQLASAVFDEDLRSPNDASDAVFDIVRWALINYGLCDDGPYVYAHTAAVDHDLINPLIAPLSLSGDHRFSTCHKSLHTFTDGLKGRQSLLVDRRESIKNALALRDVVQGHLDDPLMSSGIKACLEPFCVVGLRIASKLLFRSSADKVPEKSKTALESVLNFMNDQYENACEQEHYSKIENWKSQAGLEY